MQPNRRSAEGFTLQEKKVVEELQLTKIPIESFHGKSLFFCKQCHEWVRVAFHFKGTSPSPYSAETIYWDFIEDELGHCLADWSH